MSTTPGPQAGPQAGPPELGRRRAHGRIAIVRTVLFSAFEQQHRLAGRSKGHLTIDEPQLLTVLVPHTKKFEHTSIRQRCSRNVIHCDEDKPRPTHDFTRRAAVQVGLFIVLS